MTDFPPDGLHCPRSQERRIARRRAIPAYRCKDCDRYHTAPAAPSAGAAA